MDNCGRNLADLEATRAVGVAGESDLKFRLRNELARRYLNLVYNRFS